MKNVEEAVRRALPNGRLLRHWSLSGGISAQMLGLEVEHPNGQHEKLVLRHHSSQALKNNPNLTQNEYRLLQLTVKHDLPTATPRHFFAAGTPFETPALLLEYIDGEMRFVHEDANQSMQQMATQLAAVHQVEANSVDLSFLQQQTAVFANTLNRRTGGEDELGREAEIRARLEPIAKLPSQNPPTLLHGDFWPGNVLWQGSKLAAIIDWEDAFVGDPLYDLAIARSEIVWIFGWVAMQAFTRQYQAIMPLRYDHLPLWDLWAALRFIRLSQDGLGWFPSFFADYGRFDITPATIQANYRQFIDQALAVL